MAIDTRNKRASVLGVLSAFSLTLPTPDGTVAKVDRAHVAYYYVGIEVGEIPEAVFTAAPAHRTLTVRPDSRVLVVSPDDRLFVVPPVS